MGRDKATLIHTHGKTFLQHALDRLHQVCQEVAISGGTIDIAGIRNIRDSIDHQGPVVGIATSLQYASANQFDACLFTPVDVPWLTTDELEKMRDHWVHDPQLTIACSDRIEPLIGIYPVALSGELQQIADSSDRRLFRWIQTQPYTSLPFPADQIRNINQPDDYSEHGR